MDVDKIAIYYPNGQPVMEIGPIKNASVTDIIQLAGAGFNDLMTKMPQLTEHATKLFEAYQKAKNAGINIPGQQ